MQPHMAKKHRENVQWNRYMMNTTWKKPDRVTCMQPHVWKNTQREACDGIATWWMKRELLDISTSTTSF